MGRDKAGLPFGNEPLAARIYGLLCRSFSEVVVVTNRPEAFPVSGARLVGDRHPDRGPLEGLASGLEQVSGARALLIACDMPFVRPELLALLANQPDDDDAEAVVPLTSRGPEPLLAVYSRSLLPRLRGVLDRGERRMTSFLAQIRCREISLATVQSHDPGGLSFHNLNHPDEYAAALTLWRSRAMD